MSTLAARLRLAAAVAVTLAIVVPLGWMWWGSRLPSSYSMASLGYVDGGGRPVETHGAHAGHAGTDVATLTGPPTGTPAVNVTLTARQEDITLASGKVVKAGYTLNHTSPGPAIVARQGELVQITLLNESVPGGVTLHWHGLDVPNAEDGVAGVTQDAVGPGQRHVYRFVPQRAGTYWYHSHQVADEQVRLGLYGSLVVTPRRPVSPAPDVDVTAPVHTYRGTRAVGGVPGQFPVQAKPGDLVRIRVIDTDDGSLRTWVAGASYRLVALDGRDWHGPTPVTGRAVLIGAGGRADLEFTMPGDGAQVRVGVGGGTTSVLVSPPAGTGARPPAPPVTAPKDDLDLLTYGTPADVGFDPQRPDRTFDYRIGRRPGFVDGKPGLWWSINGHLFPDVPMFQVSLGDVVRMRITNSSGQAHPMHLHGHHVLVLSHNGRPSTGSPWWTDTVPVKDGDTYVVAFVADNPGVWADHCHNLQHASQGLVTHLEYTGYTTHFRIGGKAGNTLG
ncbi:multicopper oxidase family protein [Spongisporangium articulatum]|uniref:Multicopper oxidase family protein n=1 Tax=Spongisporangium articulatum TaxID=3362603 RepID=A0ABW8AP13_9ACTN